MDLNNPTLNLNLDDNSKSVDDVVKQEGTTINLGAGATYNQNSSNQKSSKPSSAALFKVLFVSILCDFLLGLFLYTSTGTSIDKVETKVETKVDEQMETHKSETAKMIEQAREGNIWLIRYDINRTIDLYEVRGKITQREYTRLKDEYQYYREVLKGNHGLQERWDEFTAKLLSGEVKMDSGLKSI